jgi:hypothetical protein
VQNILHGLSPGLSNAINSISRWSFIKASFPHIIHACAAALTYRIENASSSGINESLTKTETKLLYTLHWLILDAASECEDNAIESTKPNIKDGSSLYLRKIAELQNQSAKPNYLHSVATIQLFVYFFIPILKSLKPADFESLKLNNGLKIWDALWSHRQPDIKIFNTPVKQRFKRTDKSSATDNTKTTACVGFKSTVTSYNTDSNQVRVLNF